MTIFHKYSTGYKQKSLILYEADHYILSFFFPVCNDKSNKASKIKRPCAVAPVSSISHLGG
jgi:hypothetical protein